jgi:hypothetical protein
MFYPRYSSGPSSILIILCSRAFLFASYSFLLFSNKFWMGGGWGGEQCGNVILTHWRGGEEAGDQCGKVTVPHCPPNLSSVEGMGFGWGG